MRKKGTKNFYGTSNLLFSNGMRKLNEFHENAVSKEVNEIFNPIWHEKCYFLFDIKLLLSFTSAESKRINTFSFILVNLRLQFY